MFRRFLVPAAAALALIALSGAASADKYLNFDIGTPHYGGHYAPYPFPYGYPYGFRPYHGGYGHYNPLMRPCHPVVVGFRKVWNEKRQRWVRKPIRRCF